MQIQMLLSEQDREYRLDNLFFPSARRPGRGVERSRRGLRVVRLAQVYGTWRIGGRGEREEGCLDKMRRAGSQDGAAGEG